jgi:hypothetical protein
LTIDSFETHACSQAMLLTPRMVDVCDGSSLPTNSNAKCSWLESNSDNLIYLEMIVHFFWKATTALIEA